MSYSRLHRKRVSPLDFLYFLSVLSSFMPWVDIDWCHYCRSLVERKDRRSLCSAAWLSVNLWVWPSFLARVGVSFVQSSLITSVPRRALCHHYTLTCSIYECSSTFEYSITHMQMLWLCPRLWFIWVCNRPLHIFLLVNKSSRLSEITCHIKVSWSYRLFILQRALWAYCVAAQIKSIDVMWVCTW